MPKILKRSVIMHNRADLTGSNDLDI